MLIGDYNHLIERNYEVKCAYSGCKAKSMSVDMRFMGVMSKMNFVGASYPVFEMPPIISENAKNIDSDAVLRVRWDRLNFYSIHGYLGPVRIKMDTLRSGGRVHSLKAGRISQSDLWFKNQPDLPKNNYFPAVNENRLYFEIYIPRFGLKYRNNEPVVNGAVIDRVPPDNIEYELQKPVRFRSANPIVPDITLENCRMAMAILDNINVNVLGIDVSDNLATMNFEVSIENPITEGVIAIVGDTTSNVDFYPKEQFIKLDGRIFQRKIQLDLSNALWPGTVSILFVLVHPFESRSAGILTFDLQEVREGRVIDGLPEFSGLGLMDKSGESVGRYGISLGPKS